MIVNWQLKVGDRFKNTITGEIHTVVTINKQWIDWGDGCVSPLRFDMSWLELIR